MFKPTGTSLRRIFDSHTRSVSSRSGGFHPSSVFLSTAENNTKKHAFQHSGVRAVQRENTQGSEQSREKEAAGRRFLFS